MLPDSNRAEAARWLDQARGDLAGARVIGTSEGVPARLACFLAHLAGEKAMKACLIASGTDPMRTHDLIRLQQAMPESMAARFAADDLDVLNPWTIEARYPDDLDAAAEAEARMCIAASERIVSAAEAALGSPG